MGKATFLGRATAGMGHSDVAIVLLNFNLITPI